MALAIVNHGTFQGTGSKTLACTLGWSPTAGNLLVVLGVGVLGTGLGSAAPSVSDNKGNTWARKIQGFDPAVDVDAGVVWSVITTGGSSFTLTYNCGTTNTPSTVQVYVYEISGADPTAPLTVQNSAGSNSGVSASPGSVTNTSPSTLWLGVAASSDGSASGTLVSPSSPWAVEDSNTNGTTGVVSSVVAQLVSSIGAQNPTWTFANLHWAAALVGISPPLTVIAVNDPNVFYSPYNWRQNGSSWAQCYCAGSYVKLGFSGTQLTLLVDTSPLAGASAGQYPVLTWTIDQAGTSGNTSKWSAATLLSAGQTSVPLVSGLAAGNHTAWVFLRGWNSNGANNNQWNSASTPLLTWRVSGFQVDQGASTVAMPLRPKRVLFLGDSITAGFDEDSSPQGAATNNINAQYAWSEPVSSALNGEWGNVAYGGGCLCVADAVGNNVPAANPSAGTGYWDHLDDVTSRLSGGVLIPAPDYVIVNLGWNDNSAGVSTGVFQAQINDLLSKLASAAPSAQVVVMVANGQQYASQIAGASYQSGQTFLNLDSGYVNDPLSNGYGGTLTASFRSVDGVHPNSAGMIEVAARLMKAFTTTVILGGGASHNPILGGGGSF